MKSIYVNLKRFDIPRSLGGVNDYALTDRDWGAAIMTALNSQIAQFSAADYRFVFYLPEAYLLSAQKAKTSASPIRIGCQGVIGEDTIDSPNIGAYTTMRPASAMLGLGVHDTIIAHSEERAAKVAALRTVCTDEDTIQQAVHTQLESEIQAAQRAGLDVLYCVGEAAEARDDGSWRAVLKQQLTFDTTKVDVAKLKIAYEPIWAIGPNRPVPDGDAIQEVAAYIHEVVGRDLPVIYGGGLKEANAAAIAGLPDVDGGLIALTNFSEHIGFYPEQFVAIVQKYVSGVAKHEAV